MDIFKKMKSGEMYNSAEPELLEIQAKANQRVLIIITRLYMKKKRNKHY